MPHCLADRYPLAEVVAALRELFPAPSHGMPHSRHVLIEYVMLAGVNDTAHDATQLLDLLAEVEAKVNLIVFNPHPGTRFKPSTPQQVRCRVPAPQRLHASPECWGVKS